MQEERLENQPEGDDAEVEGHIRKTIASDPGMHSEPGMRGRDESEGDDDEVEAHIRKQI
jgi:hypothetical protein